MNIIRYFYLIILLIMLLQNSHSNAYNNDISQINTVNDNFNFDQIMMNNNQNLFEITFTEYPNNETYLLNEMISLKGDIEWNVNTNEANVALEFNSIKIRGQSQNTDLFIKQNHIWNNPFNNYFEFKFSITDNYTLDDYNVYGYIEIQAQIVFEYYDTDSGEFKDYEIPFNLELNIFNPDDYQFEFNNCMEYTYNEYSWDCNGYILNHTDTVYTGDIDFSYSINTTIGELYDGFYLWQDDSNKIYFSFSPTSSEIVFSKHILRLTFYLSGGEFNIEIIFNRYIDSSIFEYEYTPVPDNIIDGDNFGIDGTIRTNDYHYQGDIDIVYSITNKDTGQIYEDGFVENYSQNSGKLIVQYTNNLPEGDYYFQLYIFLSGQLLEYMFDFTRIINQLNYEFHFNSYSLIDFEFSLDGHIYDPGLPNDVELLDITYFDGNMQIDWFASYSDVAATNNPGEIEIINFENGYVALKIYLSPESFILNTFKINILFNLSWEDDNEQFITQQIIFDTEFYTLDDNKQEEFEFMIESYNETVMNVQDFYFDGYIYDISYNQHYSGDITLVEYVLQNVDKNIDYNESNIEWHYQSYDGFFSLRLTFGEAQFFSGRHRIDVSIHINHTILPGFSIEFIVINEVLINNPEIINLNLPYKYDEFNLNEEITISGDIISDTNQFMLDFNPHVLINRGYSLEPDDFILITNNYYDGKYMYFEISFMISNSSEDFRIFGDIYLNASLQFTYNLGDYVYEEFIILEFIIRGEPDYPSIEISFTEEVIEPNGFFYIEGKISDPRPYWVEFNIDSVVLFPDYISMLNKINILHWNYTDITGEFLLNFVIEEPQNLDLNEYMMNISLTLYYDGYELLVPIDFLSFFQYGLGNQNEEIKFEIISYTQLLSNDDIFELQAYITDKNGNALIGSDIQFRMFYWLNNQQYEVTLDYSIQFNYNNGTIGEGYFELRIHPNENSNLREGDYQLEIRISLENSEEDIQYLVDFTRTLDGETTTDSTNSTSVNETRTTDSVGGPQISIPAGLPGFELFYIFSIFALIPILKKKYT